MIFTNKKLPNILPTLKINETEIEWVQSFKYLGLTFDAPTLTWKEHIKELQRDTTQRLNVMRAIAGSSWGADRELLLSIYKTFIRSKLTYGIAAVSSASNTYMNTIERIQNAALRISLGARKTSPVMSMQVEADLPPLKIYCQELCCRQYFKIKSQDDNHPIVEVGFMELFFQFVLATTFFDAFYDTGKSKKNEFEIIRKHIFLI